MKTVFPRFCLPESGSEPLLGITYLFLRQVLIFLLNITPEDQRKNDKITAVLAKEIQLKHRAPVIDIVVFDSGGLPVAGNEFCWVSIPFSRVFGSGFYWCKMPPPPLKNQRWGSGFIESGSGSSISSMKKFSSSSVFSF
jgi:hypothetical protein